MKTPFSLLLILLTLSCNTQQEERDIPQHDLTNVQFECYPDTISWGDTLTLSMSTPHGKHLSILSPNDTPYYVIWWQTEPTENDNMVSLIDPHEFRNLNELKIITDQTKASPYVYGKSENEIIFTKPGVYTVRIVEQLSSDDTSTMHDYPVYYAGKR